MPESIAVSWSDFEKYGCIKCGCLLVHSNMSGGGASPVTCSECNQFFVILADGLKESPVSFGEERYKPPLVDHPRKGLWPHEFVLPDIRPKGIDGEFWSPRGVGYDLSGFVKSKQAGERIVQMIKEVIGTEPKSWLDYREREPLWIQVKIQKEDRFNLEALAEACKDGVITKNRLISCLIQEKLEDKRLELSMLDITTADENWVKSQLVQAGFDFNREITSGHDLLNGKFIYTQKG